MFLENYSTQLIQTAIHISLFIILRWILNRLVRRFARKSERVEHRTGLIIKYIGYTTVFLLLVGLIIIWGVEFTDLGLVMSSIFAVLGIAFFAQWSILSNVTSGVIMFFTFPYVIGDFIIIHDKDYRYEGVIDDIKAFHVIVITMGGEIITYPNSLLLQKGVTVIKPDELQKYLDSQEDKNVKDQPID